MSEVHILQKPVLDKEDQLSNASVLASASRQVVLTLNLRWGKKCFITHVGNAVNTSGGLGKITWELLKNGTPMYPYGANLNQWADPSLGTEIPRLQVEQGSKLEIACSNSDGATAYDCSGRIKVEYEDF